MIKYILYNKYKYKYILYNKLSYSIFNMIFDECYVHIDNNIYIFLYMYIYI